MTRTSRLFLLTLLTALLSTTTSAQTDPEQEERWFQTEIIVFEVKEKNHANSKEIWPDDPGTPDFEDNIKLMLMSEEHSTETETTAVAVTEPLESISAAPLATVKSTLQPTEQPFQQLPPDALTLISLTQKLSSSSNYAPLLHIGWRQPVLEKTAARKIHIHSLQTVSEQQPVALHTTPSFLNTNELMPPPALMESPLMLANIDEVKPAPGYSLDGTLKLHLGRYLHLEADLLYRSNPPAPEVNNTFLMSLNEVKPPQTLFRMYQTRRLRSGELHYLDHPMFGMLVLITPYELPEPAPEPEPEPIPASKPVSATDVVTPEPPSNGKTGSITR